MERDNLKYIYKLRIEINFKLK